MVTSGTGDWNLHFFYQNSGRDMDTISLYRNFDGYHHLSIHTNSIGLFPRPSKTSFPITYILCSRTEGISDKDRDFRLETTSVKIARKFKCRWRSNSDVQG